LKKMNLEKIKEMYLENLKLYNELHPIRIGNPKIWRREEPLDHLYSSLRERIEKALKFGI